MVQLRIVSSFVSRLSHVNGVAMIEAVLLDVVREVLLLSLQTTLLVVRRVWVQELS